MMKMITDTDACLKIKQAGTFQPAVHLRTQSGISNELYHRKMILYAGKRVKTPDTDTDIGTRSSPTGTDTMIRLADDRLDIIKIEGVVKGAGIGHQSGPEHEITPQK